MGQQTIEYKRTVLHCLNCEAEIGAVFHIEPADVSVECTGCGAWLRITTQRL
jgi:peptide methionine sulfoxide reductase MsrB